MAKFDKKLGGVLTKCRVITRAQCDEALAWSEKTSCSLMQSLIDMKFCDEGTLVTALAEEMNYYPIDLSRIDVSAEALEVLTEEQAKNYHVLPIARMGKLLTLAITNPFDVLILDDVKIITGCEVIPVLTTEMSISSAVERAFKKPIVAKTKSLALKAEEQLCPLFEEQNKYNIRMREFLKKWAIRQAKSPKKSSHTQSLRVSACPSSRRCSARSHRTCFPLFRHRSITNFNSSRSAKSEKRY